MESRLTRKVGTYRTSDKGIDDVGVARPLPATGQTRPSAMETEAGLDKRDRRERRDGVPDMCADAPESMIQGPGGEARRAVPDVDVEAR